MAATKRMDADPHKLPRGFESDDRVGSSLGNYAFCF